MENNGEKEGNVLEGLTTTGRRGKMLFLSRLFGSDGRQAADKDMRLDEKS